MWEGLLLGPFHGLLALIGLGIFALKLWALVDAIIRPEQAYLAAGKLTKVAWVVICALALLLGGGLGILWIASLVAAIVYLVDVRPALQEVTRGRDPYA